MLVVTLINTLVVITAVLIHYECLLRLNDWLPKLKNWSRFRIVAGVFGGLLVGFGMLLALTQPSR